MLTASSIQPRVKRSASRNRGKCDGSEARTRRCCTSGPPTSRSHTLGLLRLPQLHAESTRLAPMASPLSPQPKSAPTTSLSSSSSPPSPPPTEPAPAERPLPPLHVAAASNDLQSLYALLDSPSSSSSIPHTANDTDAEGTTPLHWAAINGHVVAAKVLLERGAEVDARGGELRGTPLMWAAR